MYGPGEEYNVRRSGRVAILASGVIPLVDACFIRRTVSRPPDRFWALYSNERGRIKAVYVYHGKAVGRTGEPRVGRVGSGRKRQSSPHAWECGCVDSIPTQRQRRTSNIEGRVATVVTRRRITRAPTKLGTLFGNAVPGRGSEERNGPVYKIRDRGRIIERDGRICGTRYAHMWFTNADFFHSRLCLPCHPCCRSLLFLRLFDVRYRP